MNRNRLVLVIGMVLSVLGLFLMYNSGFLLHPSGYVVCDASCYWYQHVYPIVKAEYWIGLASLAIGLCTSGGGAFFGFFHHPRLNKLSELEKFPKVATIT